jgi:hypothetical protein
MKESIKPQLFIATEMKLTETSSFCIKLIEKEIEKHWKTSGKQNKMVGLNF